MEYNPADDQWVSPFADEVASGGEATDGRRAPPSPHVAFDKRVLRQTFEYDWLGNTDKSGDDARGFYDRSLGAIENAVAGTPGVTEAKPYQLRSTSDIEGAADGREGQLWTEYDVAGNLTRLDVRRVGPCLPSGDCSQRFEYRWDEVGRLERARRWDTSTDLGDIDGALPSSTTAADLRYVYDASDQRILKEAVDATGVSSHTVYLFPTLELRRAAYGDGFGYDGSPEGVADYEVDRWTAVPYLLANGVRLARLAYEETTAPSRDPAEMTGEDGAVNASTSQLHVFFELGDHLGSTSVVLDKATGELVERSTFLGYGATESDYRPARWEGFREDYKFTGKEEDVEVGLQYFGKRFLNPYLGRWVSADPLAVHAPGEADLNLYAYVHGAVLKNVDPLGLTIEDITARVSVDSAIDSVRGWAGPTSVVNVARHSAKIMAWRFLDTVYSELTDRSGDETIAMYSQISGSLILRHDQMERMAKLMRTPGGSGVEAGKLYKALVHESTHAFIDRAQGADVRDFVRKGVAHYRAGHGWRAARVFDEAAAGYAGHRAGAWVEASKGLQNLGIGDGPWSAERAAYVEKRVGEIRLQYNTAMSERVFGYDHFGNETDVGISSDMKKFIDARVLDGRVGDDFDATFQGELGALAKKISDGKGGADE